MTTRNQSQMQPDESSYTSDAVHWLLEENKSRLEEGDIFALHEAICVCHKTNILPPQWLWDYLAEACRKFIVEEDPSYFSYYLGKKPKGGRHTSPYAKQKDKEATELRKAALWIGKSLGLKGDALIEKAMDMLKEVGFTAGEESLRKARRGKPETYYVLRIISGLKEPIPIKLQGKSGFPPK
jgi:hypothetical protein